MRTIWLIARRELGAYIRSPMGYVICALVLFVEGLLFNFYALGGTPKFSADVLRLFFAFATFMTMVSGVLVAMRLFAEERQLGTLTLLLTAPVRDHQIVIGKFLSGWLFFALITGLTVYMPLMIFVNGKVAVGHIVAGYCGILLLGALSLAVGLFASAISSSQIVAAVSGGTIVSSLYLCALGAKVTQSPLRETLAYLSPARHLQWQVGILQTQDLVYYASGVYLFLLLATHVLGSRRWH